LGGLLQRDQRGQLIVGLELLLDRSELHQLLSELVGVQWIERILVLQLRRQQCQEGLKVSSECGVGGRAQGRTRGAGRS